MVKKYLANKNDQDQTLLKFVKKVRKDLSLPTIYKLFRNKDIKLNNKRVSDFKIKIKENDEIIIYEFKNEPVQRDNFKLIAEPNLKVIYEDQNLLIVDKPFNLEVHSEYNLCLDNLVKSYLFLNKQYDPSQENSFVVSHIHRLDKLTAGLVLYAKNKKTHEYFSQAINSKEQIEKIYLAQLEKNYRGPKEISGYIKYDSNLQKSVFSETVLPDYKKCSMEIVDVKGKEVLIKLITGRKHQIRAIMSFYNCPIVGDFRYNGQKTNELKINLIAKKISFQNLENEFAYLNNQTFNSTNNL